MTNFWQRLFDGAPPATAQGKPARTVPKNAAPALAPAADDADAAPALAPTEISERFHRLLFALPADASGTAAASDAAILKRLELLSTRFDIRSLPRMPTVLPQLLRSLKSETAAGRELAELVGRDPLMVGEVMRVTSSVYYRPAQPIKSLQQAVILLGQDGLRRVITQQAMRPILQASAGGSGHAGEYLWEHAERCAHACAWLGKTQGGDTFEAYLAGIICHTGSGAVVRLLDQLLAEAPGAAMDSAFIAQCALLGARLSFQAAKYWELPEPVIAALDEHQQADPALDTPLSRILAAANIMAMAHMLGSRRLVPTELDFSTGWPGKVKPAVLIRCHADLCRRFPENEGAEA